MISPPNDAPRTLRRSVARWISIVGHPFVLSLLLVALGASRSLPPGRAAIVVAVVFLCAMLPMIVLIRRRMRAGDWTNFDVSVRSDRNRMYPAAIGMMVATLVVLSLLNPPPGLLEGTGAVLVLFVLAALINLKHKISLHNAFAAFVAVALLPLNVPLACTVAVLAVGIGWSRLEMGRHTLAEVVSGTVLGCVVGVGLKAWLTLGQSVG